MEGSKKPYFAVFFCLSADSIHEKIAEPIIDYFKDWSSNITTTFSILQQENYASCEFSIYPSANYLYVLQ